MTNGKNLLQGAAALSVPAPPELLCPASMSPQVSHHGAECINAKLIKS